MRGFDFFFWFVMVVIAAGFLLPIFQDKMCEKEGYEDCKSKQEAARW